MRLGALEAGGTKMVCAIGNENGEIFERISIPTETPEITLPKLIEYFKDKEIEALGIGCFGPIDVNRNSETYGYITTTPKLAWANCDIVGAFKKALNIPVGFDTDVNGSALGEATWGITKGLENSVYITIGTGVGMGIMSNGKLLHGMLHPEAGHILMRKHPEDHYEGKCPYHKTCLEGLAAGPAIEARWGKKGIELADKKEVWELEAYYIGQALVGYTQILTGNRNTFTEDIIFLNIAHFTAEAGQNIKCLLIEGIIHSLIGTVDTFKFCHAVNLAVLSIEIIEDDLCFHSEWLNAFFFRCRAWK